jgi:hypothetical protein
MILWKTKPKKGRLHFGLDMAKNAALCDTAKTTSKVIFAEGL